MEILSLFHKNQDFMLTNFSSQKSTESVDKSVTKHFFYFFSAMLVSYTGMTVCCLIFWPNLKFWCAQYVVMKIVIHAQTFQILAYSKLIRFQLELFNEIATDQLDLNEQENFRKTLFMIFDFAEKVNKTFSASLLLVMSYFYMSFLSDLHWIFMSVFEKTYLSGEFVQNPFKC